MVAGTELFFSLFNNLAIFIVLVAIYGFLIRRLDKSALILRQTILGLCFGFFAISCMYIKIKVADGVIVDQRNTIVALSGAFGGPLSAVITSLLTGAFRVHLGGAGILGGIVGIGLSTIAGIICYIFRDKVNSIFKAILWALAAAIFILPGFLFFKDLQTGWELLKAMALPYGSAIFLGIFFVGLLLRHEEHRYSAEVEQTASEKRYRKLFENLIDVSYRTDNTGNVMLISPSAEHVFGYRPEEVTGKKLSTHDIKYSDV